MATKRDYYDILGVPKAATADEIKRAYRKKAVELHPDKSGGDEAKFKELGEAYEVLKDPQKRSAYDQYGHDGPFSGHSAGSGQSGGFDGFEGFDFNNMGGFGDIFETIFRGGAGGQARPARGRDVEYAIDIDFREAVFGAAKTLNVILVDACDRCKGQRSEPGTKLKTCTVCKGAGQVTSVQNTILGSFRQTNLCPTCRGLGKVPETPCTKCHGAGVLRQPRKIEVKIPAGIDDGATIRLSGQGEAAPMGAAGGHRGDLYLHVRVKPDRRFVRQGQNIISQVKLPMAEAALGTTISVETLDGTVSLKIPPGTQSGQVLKLSGKGVPRLSGQGRGDQLVKVEVETPTRMTARQKELLEQFAKEQPSKRFWER
jgi:molecular chaperone DnaJ